MNEAYLMIGGNIGERSSNLREARKKIEERCGAIIKASSIYETEAWGIKEQDKFLNQALIINTNLTPHELLSSVLKIEKSVGRRREVKYGPRIIDIDIIFFNEKVIQEPGLIIPHPQLENRRFVLVPLAEIAFNKKHPVSKRTIGQILQLCPDDLDVHKII
jgi:2-amino-4-hydroxy-6-hydroxymethyldihydropteridine diphosphokinase